MAVAACLLLLVPTIGSFVPVPPYPVRVFPYVFLAYMLVGSGWLYVAAKRKRGILAEISADLEKTEPKTLFTLAPIDEVLEDEPEIDAAPLSSSVSSATSKVANMA
jgi:hypothetical protein